MSTAGSVLVGSPQQRNLLLLQEAERRVLAGEVENLVLLVVDRKGQLSTHWMGSPPFVIGLFEMGKQAVLRAMQTLRAPTELAS